MDFQNRAVGEYGRFEQILSQFLLKSLHIILDSRVPSLRSYSGRGEVKKSDKWFNLILGDRPAALDNLNFWRRNLMEPMIIDVMLVQDRLESSSGDGSSRTSGLGMFKETVVERWVVQYEFSKSVAPLTGESHHKKTYQKSIILLRSLHTMMRLLPAHKAFQKLLTASQTCEFDINYKVSSFNAPFSRSDEELMKKYNFTPVETQQGHISVSVTYLENLSDFNLETPASFPPEIITDYVGSPLTDPLRAFPSTFTDKRTTRTESFSSRGVQASNSLPFQRPHSWSSGVYKVQNQLPPPHSYTSSSPNEMYAHKMQNNRLPTQHKYTSSDDYHLSPPFSPSSSPSPSPSPPTYFPGGNHLHNRLHSETSPVSIPHPIMGRSPRYLSPNFSDPSRHSLPPLSPRSTRYNLSSQESPSGMKLLRKSESLRVGESSSSITSPSPEMSRDCRDDSGRFSSLASSSPRVGISRSSSRLSFQDDLDDGDFSCPFIVDDVDAPDARHSFDAHRASEFSSQKSKKSQDTAVAALVHLFRTAPPLRQDSSSFSSQDFKSERKEGEVATASSFIVPRKTSDALEELRSYKEMKDLLLSKSEYVRGSILSNCASQVPEEEKT